jgi:hypothetical protein
LLACGDHVDRFAFVPWKKDWEKVVADADMTEFL